MKLSIVTIAICTTIYKFGICEISLLFLEGVFYAQCGSIYLIHNNNSNIVK